MTAQLIWHHNVHTDSAAGLQAALASGYFTHVLLSGECWEDGAESRLWTDLFPLVRRAGAAPVLCRWLWPAESVWPRINLFDFRWYAARLERLRAEAADLQCPAALDLEPYNCAWLRQFAAQPLSARLYAALESAVLTAVALAGPADYVLPAPLPVPRCCRFKQHLYRAQTALGAASISEHTYYDYPAPTPPTWGCGDELQSVFGACVLATPGPRPGWDDARFAYTPAAILAARPRWGDRLLVYPGEGPEALATAQAFAALRAKGYALPAPAARGAVEVRR